MDMEMDVHFEVRMKLKNREREERTSLLRAILGIEEPGPIYRRCPSCKEKQVGNRLKTEAKKQTASVGKQKSSKHKSTVDKAVLESTSIRKRKSSDKESNEVGKNRSSHRHKR